MTGAGISRCSSRTAACAICSPALHAVAERGIAALHHHAEPEFVLADIPPTQARRSRRCWRRIGLAMPGQRPAAQCAGLCRTADLRSRAGRERALPAGPAHALEDELERAGWREDDITIRMTGCPNGCARPYLAEIGLVGRGPGHYNLYLGGAFDGTRMNKLYRRD